MSQLFYIFFLQVQFILNFSLFHVYSRLVCTVNYTIDNDEKISFKKFFKFLVSKPFEIQPKFPYSEVFASIYISSICFQEKHEILRAGEWWFLPNLKATIDYSKTLHRNYWNDIITAYTGHKLEMNPSLFLFKGRRLCFVRNTNSKCHK
jgi:hypothetical protein